MRCSKCGAKGAEVVAVSFSRGKAGECRQLGPCGLSCRGRLGQIGEWRHLQIGRPWSGHRPATCLGRVQPMARDPNFI